MSKVENIFREYAEATVGKSDNEVLEIVEKHLCLKFLEATRVELSEKEHIHSSY